MKKQTKITLIVVPIVLIVLGASIFATTIIVSSYRVVEEVGEATITGYIFPSFPDYFGFIIVEVPINISNNGLYPLRQLTIELSVYGEDFAISLLNGIKLGEGKNSLGDIYSGEAYQGTLAINMTENIASLAVQDGNMKIDVGISVRLDVGIFKISHTSSEVQIKPWDSPFTL